MVRDFGEPLSVASTRKFDRRTYGSPREFFEDIFFVTRNMRRSRSLMKGTEMPAAFRERIMLAVTSVYGCRYCSWVHTREALRNRVEQDEISSLLTGSVEGCPEEEAVALLYAQHWADSDGRPDLEAVSRLEEAYGSEKAQAIEVVLHMIRLGNLAGNTWDRFLHRISFGRLGGARREYPSVYLGKN
jgi:AhpD family alkylhydroperoxidase